MESAFQQVPAAQGSPWAGERHAAPGTGPHTGLRCVLSFNVHNNLARPVLLPPISQVWKVKAQRRKLLVQGRGKQDFKPRSDSKALAVSFRERCYRKKYEVKSTRKS